MSEPASSFMVGNAPYPASYAAPLVNFSQLANLPDQYFKGTQQARTLKMQNAFPDGLPKVQDTNGNPILDKNGQPQIDISAIDQTLGKIGGGEYVQGIRQYLSQAQMGQGASAAITDNADQPTAPPPTRPMLGRGDATGPGGIMGNGQAAAPAGGPASSRAPAQPTLSSMGTDNNGADTLRSIVTEHGGGQDMSPLIPRIAAAFKVDADAPLSSPQAQAIRARLATSLTPTGGGQPSPVTGAGAPVTPVSGTGGNGAPNPGTSPETAMPATGIVPNAPPQAGQQPNAMPSNAAPRPPGVPDGVDPGAFANAMLRRAQAEHARGALYAALPGGQAMSQSIENDAKAKEDRAKQILDFMGTAAQPTPAYKDMQTGAAAYNAASDAAIKSGATKLAGVVGAANQYENDLKSKVDLSQSLMNDPQMYTGTGGDFSLMLHKAQAITGDNRAAALQEMLAKVTAGSVLSQLNSMKDMMMQAGGASSSAGRIFQQYVELANKAAPQTSTTLEGNRALIELERRNGDVAVAIRDLSNDYLGPTDSNGVGTNHKFLDAGFEKVVSNYLKTHPMFSKQELADPSLVGAPTAPPMTNPARRVEQMNSWIGGMGLKPGDPYRYNGSYKMVPRITVPLSPANARPGSAQAAPAPQQ
jgi:hypothetical protein